MKTGRGAHIGETHYESVGGADPVEGDDLDLACLGRQAGDVAVGLHLVIIRLLLDIEGVEGLLLPGNENLLGSFHDEISALVLGAFAGLFEEGAWLAVENAVATV